MKRIALAYALIATLIAAAFLAACSGSTETETVVETVIVEKEVTRVERVVETVVVEKQVEGQSVRVVQTVLVEKPVTRTEKVVEVVETVVVERHVEGKSVVVMEAERAAPTPAPAAAATAPTLTPAGAPPPTPMMRRDGRDRLKPPIGQAPYDLTFFQNYGVNPFTDTGEDHLSTFAMDVDTASYTVGRRFLDDGFLPDPDSVRIEEYVNYFDYGYAPPRDETFAIHVEGAPGPFSVPWRDDNHRLMRIGIQGKTIHPGERKDTTLIFVIDVSGSMDRENRLVLVQDSLDVLVNELRPNDRVGIVVFNTGGRVVLHPTSPSRRGRSEILNAIYSLRAGGSTNAAAGLRLGYDMAIRESDTARETRVMLLSDGVANTGVTDPDEVLKMIRPYADEGVTLTTIGVGMGNFNDVLLERFADEGNGAYAYVDTLDEARRIFVDNLEGTLQTIAKDAKIQVDFNPRVVSWYRLLGYENRAVADYDFRNDQVDAGEVGAGHSVTALYEIVLHDPVSARSRDRIATVQVRYEDPDTFEVSEIHSNFYAGDIVRDFDVASPSFQLAATVAQFAEILRVPSPPRDWSRHRSLQDVAYLADYISDMFPESRDVREFVDQVYRAEWISSRLARR